MKMISSGKKVTCKFDNLADYRRTMLDETGEDYTQLSERADDWHGSDTWEDFLDLLDNGDYEITKQIKADTQKAVKEYSKKYEKQLIKYNFDVTGEFFDIGLVMTGVPEAFLTPEYGEVEKPKVDVTINGSFPDGTALKTVIANASKILGICKILEDNDVLVSIKCVTGAKKFTTNGTNLIMECPVKAYDEPINFNKCSAILSPTFLRRAGFKLMEKIAGDDLRHNYGQIIDVDESLRLNKNDDIEIFEDMIFNNGGKK